MLKEHYLQQLKRLPILIKKISTEAKDVTINYVDETGEKIHDNQVISGNISDTYDTTTPTYQLTINGYTLDTTKVPQNAKGMLSSEAQTVTYTYTKNKVAPSPDQDKTTPSADEQLPSTGDSHFNSALPILTGFTLIALTALSFYSIKYKKR